MSPILWSGQIGLDLYIGLLVPLTLIYLNEGSLLLLILWFLPILVFANLATLVYLAVNLETLISHFSMFKGINQSKSYARADGIREVNVWAQY